MDRMATCELLSFWGLSFFHKGCTDKYSLGAEVAGEVMEKMNSIMRMCYGCIVEAFAILLMVCKLCYRCCLHRLALVLLCFPLLSFFILHISLFLAFYLCVASFHVFYFHTLFFLPPLVLSNMQNSARCKLALIAWWDGRRRGCWGASYLCIHGRYRGSFLYLALLSH